MSDFIDKIKAIEIAKENLRTSINSKGGTLTEATPFSQYATQFDALTLYPQEVVEWSEAEYLQELNKTTKFQRPAGFSWQTGTYLNVPNSINSVEFLNGQFIAVGNNFDENGVATSPDGENWTFQTTPTTTSEWGSLAYGNGIYVAAANFFGNGNDYIMTSTDAITWTLRNHPTLQYTDSTKIVDVTFGNGVFAAIVPDGVSGNGFLDRVLYSTDGITWNTALIPVDVVPNEIIFAENKFVIVAYGATTSSILTSTDAINWTEVSKILVGERIAYGNGLFVVIEELKYPTASGYISHDLVNWQPIFFPETVEDSWAKITFGGGVFVITSTFENAFLVSTDGIFWRKIVIPGSNNLWSGVAYGLGKFVAVNSDYIDNFFMTSIPDEVDLIGGEYLEFPAVAPGEQVIYYLVTLVDEVENIITLNNISGNYTVDWGDGSALENYGGGSNSSTHTYDFELMPENYTIDGYKQAIIKVTPQSGFNLTSFGSSGGNIAKYCVGVYLNSSFMTGVSFSGWRNLKFASINENNITSFSNMFTSCYSLTTIPLLDTSSGTSFSNMFNSCYSLTTIPLLDTSSGTSFSNMFNSCYSLTTIPLLNTVSGNDFSSMFQFCYSLTTIPLLDTSSGTGFSRLFDGCYSLIAIPLLDTSSGNFFNDMFANCKSLTVFPLLDTSNGTNFSNMFLSCNSLASIPQINTTSGTSFSRLFDGCYSLTSIPLLDTSIGIAFNNMFSNCYSLTSIPLLDTSNGTNFSYMFNNCFTIDEIPLLDTSKGTSFSNMFNSCYSLTTIPLLDTSKGTSFSNMFNSCYSLTTIPLLDTSNCIDFSYMFNNCFTIDEIPLLNTNKGTNFSYMFTSCYSLTTISLLDTSKGTSFSNMFNSCYSLTTIPLLDTSSGTSFSNMFLSITNLRRSQLINTKLTISYQNCNLSRTALVEIFTNLFDRTSLTSQNINITSNPGATLLSPAERDIALNKNWTITG